jgi:zinc finger-like protein
VESNLFDQIARLLSAALTEEGKVASALHSELVCCTQALHTTLCQHLAKEEEQVQLFLVSTPDRASFFNCIEHV